MFSKVTAQEMTWIKSNAPKFVQLDSRQIKCTVCNSALDYKVSFIIYLMDLLKYPYSD